MIIQIALEVEVWTTAWFDTSGVAGWERSNVAAYRVWVAKTPWGWLQRHEWRKHGRNSTDLDPWITSSKHKTDPPLYTPVADPGAALTEQREG